MNEIYFIDFHEHASSKNQRKSQILILSKVILFVSSLKKRFFSDHVSHLRINSAWN